MTDHQNSSAESKYARLPCPFCGHEPYADMNMKGAIIQCQNPDCFGPRTTAAYIVDALQQWNTRTFSPAQSVGMREALIEQCAKIAEPWSGFMTGDKMGAMDSAIVEVREEIAAAIRALASQPSPAATVTDGSIQEGDVLSYTMTDGVGKITAHVRPHNGSSAGSRRDEIAAGAFYKTRGDKNNLPHIVGPLEHADDGDAPWQARVYDQIWKWGYDGLANADGSPHNRDLVERVYRPAPALNEPQGVRK